MGVVLWVHLAGRMNVQCLPVVAKKIFVCVCLYSTYRGSCEKECVCLCVSVWLGRGGIELT